MNDNKTLIKINTDLTQEQVKDIISKTNVFEGVISVKIKDGILSYDISEWASDYDVMVQILGLLEDMGIDAEPLFDGSEEVSDSVVYHEESEDADSQEDEEHEHCHEEECSCHLHHHDDNCSCENLSDKKERKYKIIELTIAVMIMIAGIILNSFEKTAKASNYVLVFAYAIAGYNAVIGGFTGIIKRKPFNQNTLMTIASIAAILLGKTLEAVGIMILFQIGELFEHSAISRADKVINDLKSFKDEKVSVLGDGGIEKRVSADKVKVGDIIVVRTGEKCSLDGVILSGGSSFNTAIITGESNYKDLGVNDTVLGGFIAVDGSVKVRVTKPYSESAVNTIAKTIEECAKNKSKAEKFLDKFSKWYTPLIVVAAIIVAFICPIFAETYRLGISVWGKRAVMLLCVSCPCSIVVSIPLAYFIGVANSAKHGVIVKSSLTLEQLSNCGVVAFDKTGTLTEGVLKVSKVISTKNYQGKILELLNICEKYSNHPIALAIRKKVGVSTLEATDYKDYAGKGVSCVYDGKIMLAGNERFLTENQVKIIETGDIGTKIYLAVDGECAGVVILNDVIRKNARGMVRELKDLGVLQTLMLTGDNKDEALAVKEYLGIDKSRAELLPEDKVRRLEKAIKSTNGTVVYLGDGVNDAPVLKRADVGIAMGNGLDVAIESADAVLTSGDLSKIPYLIKLAKRTSKIAKQNLYGSLLIKLLIIALSVTGVLSSLWFAIAGDVGLLILAILNSIRNKFKLI